MSGVRERIGANGLDWIVPDWTASPHVRALMTTRRGGVGIAPFDTMNLATHVGDDPRAVAANRLRLHEITGVDACWMEQVHGTRVVDLDPITTGTECYAVEPPDDGNVVATCLPVATSPPVADAAVTRTPGRACAVLVADCLPILLADRDGTVVAAAHGGWRGLAAGVVERTIEAMRVAPESLVAWLGPAIGVSAFEVGSEVREAFCDDDEGATACFEPGAPGKWYADLRGLARRMLARGGVRSIHGVARCTVREADAFFSYRRDRTTGRMAALIWLAEGAA